MTFDDAVEFVLTVEGGESDDSHDDGGLTRYGISSVAHPDVDVSTLTREGAIELYRHRYWEPVRCDEMPNPLRLAIFDAAIQHGQTRAVKLLQKSLRIAADGIIGPQTLSALGRASWDDLLVRFLAKRVGFYVEHPDWPVFGFGWSRRMFLLYQATLIDGF